MNDDVITRETEFELDPANPPRTDWHHFDRLTDQERHEAGLADPDCPPATEEQLARAHRVPNIKAIRRRLSLTQEEFARRFGLSLGTVRDWERGSHQPDQAARTLLRVIAFNPEVVQQALRQD